MKRPMHLPFIVLLVLIAIFLLGYFGEIDLFFCNKCVSEAAIFELKDKTNNKYIIDPIIIVKRVENNNKIRIDTLHSNKSIKMHTGTSISEITENLCNDYSCYFVADSILIVNGKPGKYSFNILKEGYNNINLENVMVKSSGNPRCKYAKSKYYKIDLQRQSDLNEKDTLNIILIIIAATK